MYCGVWFFLIKKNYGKQKKRGGGVQAKVGSQNIETFGILGTK
jgi:hypothetical protein